VSHGATWQQQRARLQPLFSQSSVDRNAGAIVETTTHQIEQWRAGDVKDMHREMVALALTIAGRVFCASDIHQHAGAMHTSLRAGADSFVELLNRTILPPWTPTPGNFRSRKAMRMADGLFYSMIEHRKRHGGPDDDALGTLMAGRDEQGMRLSDQAIRDDLLSLILGGHETTALAMAWLWNMLATHPELQDEAAAEVESVLGGELPQATDRRRLPVIRRILQESLRMYPPFWGLWREAVTESEVAGVRIRPGQSVMVSQWLAQRDPRYFERPSQFCPARWSADGAGAPSVGAYFPFGMGPRTCIAAKFAITEMTLIVATVLQRYRLLPSPNHEVRMHPSFTLRPKNGVPLLIQPR
jgi:cytochrome P450